MIEGILIEGLIYGIMVLAVFVSFRVLNFCDMTVDGSFPLGAAVLATCLSAGMDSALALILAFIAGCLAGVVTALIHTKLKMPDLLAGILTMTMLYSINLRIMGDKANISLLRINTFFSAASATSFGAVAICVAASLVIKLLLDLFFHTDMGLCMGGLGANQQMIVSQGINPDLLKIIGLAFSNGLVAISGAFYTLYQGFADVGMGTGTIVAGLASLMLGEFCIRSNKIGLQTLRALIGSIIYRALMYLARNYGYYIHMGANDLKLITGILIIICVCVSRIKVHKKVKEEKEPVHA
jgi:putative ABC transport system permease protein